jgi:hypothetical protein
MSFEACLRFVREKYELGGEVPSVRRILSELKLSRARFYAMFPGGLDELCEKLGIPPPERRMKATERASNVRRAAASKLSEIHLGTCPTCGEPVTASDALRHMRHERIIEKPVVVERVIERTVEKPVAVPEVQRIVERPVERVVREVVEKVVKMNVREFDDLARGVASSPAAQEAIAKLREELLRAGWLET